MSRCSGLTICVFPSATYGGHLELSAFAHMTRRNAKVIQPGLVYVIEWAAGGESEKDAAVPDSPPPSPSTSTHSPTLGGDATLTGRDKRRARRDQKRVHDKPPPDLPTDLPEPSDYPIYVACVFPMCSCTASVDVLMKSIGTTIGNTSHRYATSLDLMPGSPMYGKPRSQMNTTVPLPLQRGNLRPR